MCVGALETVDSLALELQVIMSLLTWLLRTKLGSSVKAGGTLSHPVVVSSSQAFTTKIRGWRDDSVMKSTGHSSRGPVDGFKSHHSLTHVRCYCS